MKSVLKKVVTPILILISLVAIAGVIKFNIIGDDLYQRDNNGNIIKLDTSGKDLLSKEVPNMTEHTIA